MQLVVVLRVFLVIIDMHLLQKDVEEKEYSRLWENFVIVELVLLPKHMEDQLLYLDLIMSLEL